MGERTSRISWRIFSATRTTGVLLLDLTELSKMKSEAGLEEEAGAHGHQPGIGAAARKSIFHFFPHLIFHFSLSTFFTFNGAKMDERSEQSRDKAGRRSFFFFFF